MTTTRSAVVQYRQRFASSLPAEGTLLRGYVQLSTVSCPGTKFALTNVNLNPAIAASPALLPDGSAGSRRGRPALPRADHRGHEGPPVRILFRNLLPTDVAGNLFLPVDTSLMGSGMGPAQ